jgi:DNA-binding MarR family transcriptional regulator
VLKISLDRARQFIGEFMAKSKSQTSRTSPLKGISDSYTKGARAKMFRDVVTLFYATTGRLRSMKRLVASSVGLNTTDYSIVAALYRLSSEPGVRVNEIAEYLHVSPENVTMAVQRLVANKWVTKTNDPNDARAVTLRLRPNARKRIDRLTTELREINELWFQKMKASEVSQLMKFLERTLDNFDAAYAKARDTLDVSRRR